jgi:hypothetical protein
LKELNELELSPFESAVNKATVEFLNSVAQRTYTVNGVNYVAHFCDEIIEYDDGTSSRELTQTDWGFCYSCLVVPTNYPHLANLHTRAQLNMSDCALHEIAQRYYYAIMREVADYV